MSQMMVLGVRRRGLVEFRGGNGYLPHDTIDIKGENKIYITILEFCCDISDLQLCITI